MLIGERLKKKNRKPVVRLEDNKIFESLLETAEDTGTKSGEISSACRGERNTAGGKHFMFLEDYLAADEETSAKWLAKPPHRRKNVICLETGKMFKSTREAARKYDIDHRNIARACKKPTRTAGGYHWEFVD